MPTAKMHPKYNVTIRHLDQNGNIKKIWQESWLMSWLMKKNIITPYAYKIPFLFGSWQNEKVHENLIVNTGFAGMASRFNGSGAEAAFTYIAIGIGTTAPAVTDTTLESEITTGGGGRTAATVSRVTTNVTNDTAQDVANFTFSLGFAVTESGIFNDAAAGTMAARQTFSAVNVVSTDSVQTTWKVSYSA